MPGRLSYYLVWALIALNWGASSDESSAESKRPLRRIRRIINGNVPLRNEFPYAVSIQAKLRGNLQTFFLGGVEHFCGGTLIDSQWIVTAAHCMFASTDDGQLTPLLNVKLWHARLGSRRLRPSFIDRIKGLFNRAYNNLFGYSKLQAFYHLQKIILHPQYTEGLLENDIALLKLKEKVLIHRMRDLDTIHLPKSSVVNEDWPLVGQKCMVVGWGCACANCPPEMNLQAIQIPVIDPAKCREMYRAPINLTVHKEFCAGFFNKNTGICPGDSGGPLICEVDGARVLSGIVSATHSKHPESFPAVYTRVSHFSRWISDTIQAN